MVPFAKMRHGEQVWFCLFGGGAARKMGSVLDLLGIPPSIDVALASSQVDMGKGQG